MFKKIAALAGKIKKRSMKTGDTYYGDKAREYHKKRIGLKKWQIEQSVVQEYLAEVPDGSSVLDLPFGTGRFVPFYLEKGMTIYGMDISNDMIDAAREVLGDAFNKCHITVGDATAALPFSDNFFDVAVCWRFLKFFSYNTAAHILKELHRVTRSTIILRMIVRKEEAPPVGPPRRLKKLGGNIYEKDFLELLNQTGFTVIQRKKIYDGAEEESYGFESEKQKEIKKANLIFAYMLKKRSDELDNQ